MMSEMMKLCCGDDGMPSFEKMKQFMEQCGKKGFTEEHMAMMKAFCAGKDIPDVEKMKVMMEKCGCHIPDSKVSQ
jgi:pentatricopeptide repeat protein